MIETIYALAGLVFGVLATAIFFIRKKSDLIELQTNITFKDKQIADIKTELSEKNSLIENLKIESATIISEKKSLEEKIDEFRKEQTKNQENLKTQFENLANKIFEQKTDRFKLESEKSLTSLINPLKEQLGNFQKKIDESFGDQAKEQRSLKDQIINIVQASEKMRVETESLSKALRGDVKAQGNWGEMILERILEDSGLRKDIDYIVQANEMGLKSTEDDRLQKPDVLVKIPGDKQIIIDSKVSLTHYERYNREENEAEKIKNLNLFLNSIREHIKNLEGKRYQDNQQLKTPDFVLMFMPIEGAYSLAIQKDEQLHNFAWHRRVIIVCPATLFATLATISSLWKIDNHNKNAAEIAKLAGGLHDKFIGFLDDMSDIEKHIDNAGKAYNSALNKLSRDKGNLVSRIEKLKDLGAKTTKKIPAKFSTSENLEEENVA